MIHADRLQFAGVPTPVEYVVDIRPPDPDERSGRTVSFRWLSVETVAFVLVSAVVFAFALYFLLGGHLSKKQLDSAAIQALVARIITVESNGDPNARNPKSSATGAGQFLDATWLEAVRRYRRDLLKGRDDKQILDLRRDAKLSREIATRLVEHYAVMLNKRHLPVTPGTLYLTYFAGPAGGVAVLTGAESADAATLMASADVTGRATREKLVSANPFLARLTVGDLKAWADRKMASR